MPDGADHYIEVSDVTSPGYRNGSLTCPGDSRKAYIIVCKKYFRRIKRELIHFKAKAEEGGTDQIIIAVLLAFVLIVIFVCFAFYVRKLKKKLKVLQSNTEEPIVAMHVQ